MCRWHWVFEYCSVPIFPISPMGFIVQILHSRSFLGMYVSYYSTTGCAIIALSSVFSEFSYIALARFPRSRHRDVVGLQHVFRVNTLERKEEEARMAQGGRQLWWRLDRALGGNSGSGIACPRVTAEPNVQVFPPLFYSVIRYSCGQKGAARVRRLSAAEAFPKNSWHLRIVCWPPSLQLSTKIFLEGEYFLNTSLLWKTFNFKIILDFQKVAKIVQASPRYPSLTFPWC